MLVCIIENDYALGFEKTTITSQNMQILTWFGFMIHLNRICLRWKEREQNA